MRKEDFLRKWKGVVDLPGIQAHQMMMPKSRPFTREEVNDIDIYRQSAVGIVCYVNDQAEVSFLLIERPEYDGEHSGQMAFPGGKMDEDDVSILAAARREVWEEVGIELSEKVPFIEMTEMLIPVSRFIVTPFLFFMTELPTLTLSEREVKKVFHITIDELLDDKSIKQADMKVGGNLTLKAVPYFELQRKVVWGATAVILSELKEMFK